MGRHMYWGYMFLRKRLWIGQSILIQWARYFKENPKGVREMCKAMEDMRNEAPGTGADSI